MASTESTVTPSVIFVPSVRVDRGMGHLRRCLAAVSSMGSAGALYFAANPEFLEGRQSFDLHEVRKLVQKAQAVLWEDWPASRVVQTVVCDLQSAPADAVAFLRDRAVRLIGWDDGGTARAAFPYLIDSLPHDSRPAPNVRLPGLLNLPFTQPTPTFDRPIRRVLAVFGGSDPVGLTPRFLKMVHRLQKFDSWPYELTVVRGPLSRFIVPKGTQILEAPERLSERLGEWDLVVTSWGLTALEALAASTPAVLLNPTLYHERLARRAGLPSFGVKKPRVLDFWKAVDIAGESARSAFTLLLAAPTPPGRYFTEYEASNARCPVCDSNLETTFFRSPQKSYHRCSRCTMEYLSVHNLPAKVYNESYFNEEYQRQYGKTYLEDFRSIQSTGRVRIEKLEAVSGPLKTRRVLDVGCAYGPFLAAVSEAQGRPFGVDVVEEAVKHVQTKLGFPAQTGSFLEFSWSQGFPGEPRPDIITMWYVIEHFPNLALVFRKIRETLTEQGILAFSTPHGAGISRKFRFQEFWTQSPDDHFTIWNRRNAKRVLDHFGFDLLSFRVTGHHPERFPRVGPPGSVSYRIISFLSQLLGWGDTFEVYARKREERR